MRGAISVTHAGEDRRIVHFADYLTNVYALDARDGRLIWKTKVGRHKDAAVTGSVSVHAGRVYVPLTSMEVAAAGDPAYQCCTSSGAVVALDAQNGTELWYHRVIPEPAKQVGSTSVGTGIFAPSGAPVWSSPTVDATRGRLYIGTGENYTRPATDQSDAVLALDLRTGALAWSFQGTREDAYNYACSSARRSSELPETRGPRPRLWHGSDSTSTGARRPGHPGGGTEVGHGFRPGPRPKRGAVVVDTRWQRLDVGRRSLGHLGGRAPRLRDHFRSSAL